MNASFISALAALVGATIGGLTSALASWLVTRTQARAQWLAEDILREQASQCYIHALQHDKADIETLVPLYALIARMRVLSSRKIIESAERIGRTIIDTYMQPDKTFLELRDMVHSGSIDLIRDFSELCRAELDSLRTRRF